MEEEEVLGMETDTPNLSTTMVAAVIRLCIAATGLLSMPPSTIAQLPQACECTDLGSETYRAPDTVFHVRPGFDVAFCGHIERSVQPYVYSEFTMRSCGLVQVPLMAKDALQECHLSLEGGQFIVEELALLPTGADMHLERRPCWRRMHWLFLADDSSASAIGAPTNELIAKFLRPTPAQFTQVQQRLDALKPEVYWTDEELLGQVFLCGLFDAGWAKRFQELRENYLLSGAMAEFYNELLQVFNDKRAGSR